MHTQDQARGVVAVEHAVEFAVDELLQRGRVFAEFGAALFQCAQDAGTAVQHQLAGRTLCSRRGGGGLGGLCAGQQRRACQQGRGDEQGKQ